MSGAGHTVADLPSKYAANTGRTPRPLRWTLLFKGTYPHAQITLVKIRGSPYTLNYGVGSFFFLGGGGRGWSTFVAMAVALVSGNFVVRQPILTSHTPRALQAPAESACALGMQVHSSDVCKGASRKYVTLKSRLSCPPPRSHPTPTTIPSR